MYCSVQRLLTVWRSIFSTTLLFFIFSLSEIRSKLSLCKTDSLHGWQRITWKNNAQMQLVLFIQLELKLLIYRRFILARRRNIFSGSLSQTDGRSYRSDEFKIIWQRRKVCLIANHVSSFSSGTSFSKSPFIRKAEETTASSIIQHKNYKTRPSRDCLPLSPY